MVNLDEFRGEFFNSAVSEQGALSERKMLQKAIQNTLLPKFEAGVFKTVAAKYYNTGGTSLTAHFGKTSLRADSCGGSFVVTIQREDSMISFGSVTEDPLNHFRNPRLMSYLGKPEDWNLMIDQVAQGLKRAKRRGNKPLIEASVLSRVLGS